MAIATACEHGVRRPVFGARLVLWTDTRGGGTLRVTIDGMPAGELTDYVVGERPGCATRVGVVITDLNAGSHTVMAHDGAGRRWNRTVILRRSECAVIRLAPFGTPANSSIIAADSGDGPT